MMGLIVTYLWRFQDLAEVLSPLRLALLLSLAAIGILIRALGSREESTRTKAHTNLVRITGQDLPPEREVWEKWWKERLKASGRE